MARTFFGALVENKAMAKPAEAIARATGSSPGAAYSSGLGPVGPWDIDYAVRNGLEKVIWVFRCIDVIATNQAGLNILLRRGYDRQFGKTIDDPRLWKLLNFRTNLYERSWQTRYRLSATLLLARRGAFLEVINGEDGRPSELHLLPPGVTEPIPDKKKFVSGYKVTRGDYQIDELKPEQVIWLRLKPHPTDPYAQMTPLMSAGIDCDTDFLARLFNRNFLANDGRPGMFITIDGGPGGMNPTDAEIIKSRFGGGPARAGQTTVVEAVGINVQDLGANPRDVQWGDLLTTSKERLLLAFGVPESVMGNASGRTFDNADAERENFWLDTMVPHCDNLAASLDPLSGDIEDDTVFGFDYEKVDVLQRMIRAKREEWRQELAAGLINLATYQERTGQKVVDHPAARAYFLANGVAIPGKPEDAEAVKELTPIGAAPAQDPAAAAEAGARKGSALGMRKLNNLVASRAWNLGNGQKSIEGRTETKELKRDPDGHDYEDERTTQRVPNTPKVIVAEVVEKAHPYLGLRHRLEGSVEGVLTAWDMNQENVVCARLGHANFKRYTRHWESKEGDERAGTKALDPGYAVEVDRWVKELKASIEAVLGRAVRGEIRATTGDMLSNGVLDMMIAEGLTGGRTKGSAVSILFGKPIQDVAADVVADVMSIVDEAARNQSKRLMARIEEADKSGADMKSIEREIRLSVGARAPWRKALATNVVTTAVEGARASVYSKAGDRITKVWNTVGDERVRTSHKSLDGQQRPASKAFRAGVSSLQYPGDPTGAPEDVINCRCYLEWRANFG